MRTDPAKADRKPGPDTDTPKTWRSWWRGWRAWLPFLVKPLRRGIVLFVIALVIEYLVVPELVGASKDLNLLGRVNMDSLDDPFAAVDRELNACPLGMAADAAIVDMHAEATSEKMAMGHFCDGRARGAKRRRPACEVASPEPAQPSLLERRTGLGREVSYRVNGLEQGPH